MKCYVQICASDQTNAVNIIEAGDTYLYQLQI